MTIKNYTFFSPNGTEFPVSANADAKLYMMLAGMAYTDAKRMDWIAPVNTALNRVYKNTSVIVGGRYFELLDEAIQLNASSDNYIHVNIDLTNATNPVFLSVENRNLSNNADLNNSSRPLKQLLEIVKTNTANIVSVQPLDEWQNFGIANVHGRLYSPYAKIEKIEANRVIQTDYRVINDFQLGYGRTGRLMRIGNIVFLHSTKFYTISRGDTGKWISLTEKVPVGFRPTESTLTINFSQGNMDKRTQNEINADGSMRLFTGIGWGANEWFITPQISWITQDPFPE